jgi:hypothetical protein
MHGSAQLADGHLIAPFDDETVLSKVRSQFKAMEKDSVSDAELFGFENQMSELQRTRFAAALQRLAEKSSIRPRQSRSLQETKSPA